MTNYLPRINTILNDQGLKIAPPPAGPKVTLLGVTSNTGITLLEPYTVTSVEKAINSLYFSGVSAFNSSDSYPGELALAIEETANAGAENIEVIVIGHYSGTALLNYLNPLTSQTGRYSDLSGAYEVLRNRDLDVVVPVGAYIDNGASNKNLGKQLANFCFQATTENNACVGVIATQPVLHWAATRYSGLKSDATLSGELVSLFGAGIITGNLDMSTYTESLLFATPSSRLTNEYVAYHTRPGRSASFNSSVYSSTYYDTYYLGYLSGSADQDGDILEDVTDSTATAVNAAYMTYWQAADSDGTLAVDSRNIKVDGGAYLSVVTAPLVSIGTQTKSLALAVGASPGSVSYTTDGAASYAGLINTLSPQSATTNKQIPGINSLKLLSARQANDLVGMRHVTLYSRTKGLTVASGITGAHYVTRYVKSDYTRQTTVRIVHATVDLIRAVAEKYIGEANNAPQRNALDAEIDQVLTALKSQGALNAANYNISSTPDQAVLGIVDINLDLVPAFEITTINLTVSVSKSL